VLGGSGSGFLTTAQSSALVCWTRKSVNSNIINILSSLDTFQQIAHFKLLKYSLYTMHTYDFNGKFLPLQVRTHLARCSSSSRGRTVRPGSVRVTRRTWIRSYLTCSTTSITATSWRARSAPLRPGHAVRPRRGGDQRRSHRWGGGAGVPPTTGAPPKPPPEPPRPEEEE
jgi:hypothetical protein